MPLFTAPVAAYSQISESRSTEFPLPTADTENAILNTDSTRKGHLVRNTGTTRVTVIYGIKNAEETTELYRFTLTPGDSYLYDIPEIIPYTAIPLADGGTIQVVELF